MSHLPRPTPTCPVCGAESRGWLLCRDCTGKLRSSLRLLLPERPPLGVLPWEQEAWPGLPAMLEEQLARLGQTGTGNGGRGADDAVPFDGGARLALDALQAALALAMLDIGHGDRWPADPPRADRHGRLVNAPRQARDLVLWAGWLLERVDQIRGHDNAARIFADVRHAVGVARSMVDQSEANEFAGECEICGGSMFARHRSSRAICTRCERVVDDAPARRATLLEKARAGLATRDDILDAAPSSYGVVIRDSTFAGWVKRGRITPKGRTASGVPMYLVGEVLDLAAAREAKRQPGFARAVDIARQRPLTRVIDTP